MIRYAVATNYETEQGSVSRFFTGALTAGEDGGLKVVMTTALPGAWATPLQGVAAAVARGLTEMFQATAAPRNWVVVELHDAIKRSAP